MSVSPVNPSLTPTAPDAAPVAKIYSSGGSLQETVKLPVLDITDNIFGKQHLLGSGYSAGRYLVIYQWVLSSVTYQSSAMFDVVAGGDADGQVVGMKTFLLPTGRHVIYQTESGKLVSGRNPRV